MNWFLNRIEAEPVGAAAVVRAGIVLGTAFGLGWSGAQVAAVYTFSEILFSFLARRAVTPNGMPT